MDFYVIFEGLIDQQATLRLVNAMQAARTAKSNNIVIFFSSLGGNIYEGFVLASIIQNSQIPVTIHATNHIDSIANVIYLSAKNRTSESYTKFYLHGASQNGTFDEKLMKDALSAIRTNNSRIAYFISENSKLQLKKVQSMMRIGTTISAQDALKYKIVHQITHREIGPSIPRDEIIYIN